MIPVLDASALIAFLGHEPGHKRVGEILDSSIISTVNLAEVGTFLTRKGHPDPLSAIRGITRLGVQLSPFSSDDAERTASLWHGTHENDLSLGDRACLALTLRFNGVALTTDPAWATLDIDAKVELIR